MLTPEQNERWRGTVNPLDYLDFYALSKEGLNSFTKRIKPRRGAPGWALTLREQCLHEAWKSYALRAPVLALRSEVAMVGLKLLHTASEDRVNLYRRILLDFLNRALRPFDLLCPVIPLLRELCVQHGAPSSAWEALLPFIRSRSNDSRYVRQEHNYLALAQYCIQTAQAVLFTGPNHWWTYGGYHLTHRIALMYTHRAGPRWDLSYLEETDRERGPYEIIANAFVDALECECPPPDWLPAA